MSIKPEVLDALLAAGATAEMIVAAIKADAVETEAKRARKREADRDRQRRHRSRDVTDGHASSRPVTRDSGDTPSLPPSPQTPQPPTHPHDETTRAHEGPAGEVVELRPVAATDWPEGDAHRHAQLLMDEVASVRLDMSRQPGLLQTLGRLAAWRAAGASWRFDVLPTVTAVAGRSGRPITSWKFFDDAIAQSIAANRQALTIPEAPHAAAAHVLRPSPKRSARDANLARALAGAASVVDERAGHG